MTEEQKNKIAEEQEKIIADIEASTEECPMDNVGFDPNTIDGRGEI